MTLRDYTANVISASKVVPDGNFKDSKASGVWDINEALDLIKGGNWPNAANFNPSAFVDALFQTHLYDGNNSSNTISNNIDLSGEGGLVWIKSRSGSAYHTLFDTARGVNKALFSNATDAETSASYNQTFTSSGFTLNNTFSAVNDVNANYVSWTFRKQPKFFDIVTYSGTGSAGLTVNHNLGSVPGMIIVKATGLTSHWQVLHRNDGTNWKNLQLDQNGVSGYESDYWGNGSSFVAPTSTAFTVGTGSNVNSNGYTYVAYLFAHNNNDGGFGEPGNQDIIKCGTFATDSSGNATVTLGFEPQFVMNKVYDAADNWTIADNMRGFNAFGDQRLYWNLTNAEATATTYRATSTGFTVNSGETSKNFIYMAIRRGGMQTPTAASSVFEVFSTTNNTSASNIGSMGPSDFILNKRTDGSQTWRLLNRLCDGTMLRTDSTDEETDDKHFLEWDRMTGVGVTSQGAPYLTNDAQTH